MLPVEIIPDGDDCAVIMTQAEPFVGDPFDNEMTGRIAHALGILPEDIREDCPVSIASAGHSKIMVGIKSRSLLDKLNPNDAELIGISHDVGCNGYYVFTLSPSEDILVHGRMFAPAIGIREDPVTGNANGPLGIYLVHYHVFPELQSEDAFDFYIRQGEAIHRDGGMKVHVEKQCGNPVKVQIIGRAVIAFKTEIEL